MRCLNCQSMWTLILALLIFACSGSDGGSENAPLIVGGELYTAPLFGTFTLSREGVDPATISIRVLSDANALIDLVRNTHYIVEPSGNTMLITIVSLPPPAVTAAARRGMCIHFR